MKVLIAISGLLVHRTCTPIASNSLNLAESSFTFGIPGNHAILITPFSRAFCVSSELMVSAQRLTESPGLSLSRKFSGVGFRSVLPFSSFMPEMISWLRPCLKTLDPHTYLLTYLQTK